MSTLPIPGLTLTATIFDFCSFELTTGTVRDPSWVFGTCAAEGNASRIRWRCRVRMMVRKERIPSWRKIGFGFELAREVLGEEDGGDDDDEVGDKKVGRKGTLAAAA